MIVKQEAGFRVRLVQDHDAMKPENDGATPIIRVLAARAGGVILIEGWNRQAEPYVEELRELYHRGDSFTEALTALRKRYDSLHYDSYGPNQGTDYKYIAFDTRDFREAMGLAATDATTDNTAAQSLTEVKAWIEGDCWGWIVEKRRIFTKTYEDGVSEHGEDWEEWQACWGYYGEEYAKEAALEELSTTF